MAEDTGTTSASLPPAADSLPIMADTSDHKDGQVNAKTEEQGVDLPGEDKAEDAVKTNGDTQHSLDTSADTTENPPSDPAATAEDVEMKNLDDVANTGVAKSSPPAVPTNGTPASSKKMSGSAKKKSTGVPEHKTRKLNKKKSRPIQQLDAQPGEHYLARLKGHAPWPAIICDEAMLTQSLLNTRPVTALQADGTFKKPEYADGGKRAYERTFPVMFLATNEFAWVVNTELTPLDPATCTAPEKAKGKLREAFEIAAESHDLDHYKDILIDHMKAMAEEEQRRAENEAKKASKSKRKSVGATATDVETEGVDDMDVDEDEGEAKPKSKKRKKSMDSDGAGEKPAKTPKTAMKLKLSVPKTPTTDSASKKKTPKPKGTTKKGAAKAAVSDDEVVDTPKVEEKPLTPAEAKAKKEKEVLYYRHKLQKGFLSRDTMPKEEEMKSMSDFVDKLETFPDLEGSIIRQTKIHKVLKQMMKLPSIPKDEEYQFKKRAHELLAKWNKNLLDDPSAGTGMDKDDDPKPEAATTNGTSKETEEQAAKAEAGEAAAPEEESREVLENKIGTTIEGEKEAEGHAEPEKPAAEEEVKSTEEVKTDEPNVESAPSEAFQPPSATAEETA